jgi:hypothetical protein
MCFNLNIVWVNINQLLSLPFFVDSYRFSQELIILSARIEKKHWPQKKKEAHVFGPGQLIRQFIPHFSI